MGQNTTYAQPSPCPEFWEGRRKGPGETVTRSHWSQFTWAAGLQARTHGVCVGNGTWEGDQGVTVTTQPEGRQGSGGCQDDRRSPGRECGAAKQGRGLPAGARCTSGPRSRSRRQSPSGRPGPFTSHFPTHVTKAQPLREHTWAFTHTWMDAHRCTYTDLRG